MSQPIRSRPARGSATRVRTGSRTLAACIRFAEIVSQCDEQIPACSSCLRNNTVCLVEDPVTKRHQPRNYLELLEQRVLTLERQLHETNSILTNTCTPLDVPPLTADQSVTDSNRPTETDADSHADDLASMVGTLSLNAAGAEPSYLGPSSTFAFTRFLKLSMRQAIGPLSPNVSEQDPDRYNALAPDPCLLPDYQTARQLSNAYFENVHAQYPFLHEQTFREWEAALADPSEAAAAWNLGFLPLYFLNMVYAVGATLLPNMGYAAEQLYASAMLYIDDIISHDNLESIQAVLCCAVYSIRSTKGISHWKLAGQALRQCINLGYHRDHKRFKSGVSPFQQEMRKRVFWSAYVMECAAAVMLGRPLGLHFEEIDVEVKRHCFHVCRAAVNVEKYPLDIEESQLVPDGVIGSARSSTDTPTMMTYAIHGFKVRILLGRIQTALYSDCTIISTEERQKRIQKLSLELDKWWAECPQPRAPPRGGALSFYRTPDFYEINRNYAILMLYRTQMTDTKTPAPDEVFLKCMQAAQNTCHSCRRQFLGKKTAYTWGAVHELFLAGLTYVYCLWTSAAARAASRQDQASSVCTDCTMVLVILAERCKDAAPYRDIFEVLASRTMTMLADLQQGKAVETVAISHGQRYCPEELPQWMEGITHTGYASGVDRLLSELIDECPASEATQYEPLSWNT
ncbi:hypothetical protein CkaCkLH20_02866 [Colletotrichum karsti]|uniref:Xylanolytic transcriptional activator regulatory domain-containing protein n=1 Tax=Colletotrichum karsti TaxID=1095194 RepID=A0A9P6I8V2_9PEZI|nr:uncharacterized protein CkaCkLH20_02866 [Colletotrichum karsti]KAF9879323.1 hypothetical protein CkaCkLH20_02866 [Colletotrichum karsti]